MRLAVASDGRPRDRGEAGIRPSTKTEHWRRQVFLVAGGQRGRHGSRGPIDLYQWITLIAFEGIVGTVALLLILTFVAFRRMERDVRRARMFLMADRIHRFLGAFTAGFVVLAVVFASGFVQVALPPGVAAGAFFVFLAAVAYGVIELYFIIRPKRKSFPLRGSSLRLSRRETTIAAKPVVRHEDDGDAPS